MKFKHLAPDCLHASCGPKKMSGLGVQGLCASLSFTGLKAYREAKEMPGLFSRVTDWCHQLNQKDKKVAGFGEGWTAENPMLV